MAAARVSLPIGTLLGAYRLLELIGKGGFSLIYRARMEDSGDEVVIKEFMPKKVACRGARGQVVPMEPSLAENLHRGRKLFFNEVKALASIEHPNIVRVLDFFLAHATCDNATWKLHLIQGRIAEKVWEFISEDQNGGSTCGW